jgi:indolepyruvate ferredoxin oxidoreductase alpha subunit
MGLCSFFGKGCIMKKLGEMLLEKLPFSELVMGNTAVVRGMEEAGIRVVTSYPGSPTPEIASAIADIPLDKRPFYFEFCVNEKVAVEVAFGAAMNGRPGAVFFKSVGLNVAADTFVQLNHMEIPGGLVVIAGDDPGAHSSQNEQDNRHLARMSYTPVFEPASPAEAYRFFLEAASLAGRYRMAVMLRLTTHVCHAKERVSFAGWKAETPDDTPIFSGKEGACIPIGAAVARMKKRALERLSSAADFSMEKNLHRLLDNGNSQRGVITAGLPFLSLLDALSNSELKPDILKLGMVYPVNVTLVEEFLNSHSEILVIEELDDFLEQTVKAICCSSGAKTRVMGKLSLEDWIGEYTPDRVKGILSRAWPDLVQISPPAPEMVQVPARFPQMCPGCGHRSAFFAIGKVLRENDISVADIGCHTLGFLPPYEIGQVLMSMGASTGIGQGLSLFNTERRVVAFLGDSTFFHAGIPGIINALFNKHRFTLIVMENGTTAMTGHQNHPGTGRNFSEPTDRIPIRSVLQGLGVKDITEVDTYNQKELGAAVQKALDAPGFSVVIAKHPCMLKFAREQSRKPGYVPRHVAVKQEQCTLSRECIDRFGCPSFNWNRETRQVTTNHDICIGDGSCLQTCPAAAITPIPSKEVSQ